MYRFYVEPAMIAMEKITVIGSDVNHIKNVLRMRTGEKVIACDGQGKDYFCTIAEFVEGEIHLSVNEIQNNDTELTTKISLFQGLPKKDKMELIIQKAVELGVYEIVPVIMKRTIVKLEDKKKESKKLERWQEIAKSAAKQSGRGFIPRVHAVITYDEAITLAASCDMAILPYECASGIKQTKEEVKKAQSKATVGVIIGPEGGFEEEEIKKATEKGIVPITLGKRILRTETAGLAILSVLMFELEQEV